MKKIKGKSNTRLYRIWHDMKRRCDHPQNKSYPYYGGKGIKVCKQWYIFEIFYRWSIYNGYKDDLTLDRVDNNKGYQPSNCRWVTRAVQSRNSNHCIKYKGETASEASRRLGGDASLVFGRIKKCGWSIEDAFTIPARSLPNGYSLKSKRDTLT